MITRSNNKRKDNLIMEKIEKFAISEEALEQVVGGFNKSQVKKILIGAGIVAASVIAGGAIAGAVSYVVIKNKKANKKADDKAVPYITETEEWDENTNEVWNEYINS